MDSLAPVVQIEISKFASGERAGVRGEKWAESWMEFPSPNLSPQRHAGTNFLLGGERESHQQESLEGALWSGMRVVREVGDGSDWRHL
jgi:hypothetical protein